MASSSALSRLNSAFTVAAASASKWSSSMCVLNRQVTSSPAKSLPNFDAHQIHSPTHSKLPLVWTFNKHAPALPSCEAGVFQVDPSYNLYATDPLSKIKDKEMELSMIRSAESPSPLKLIFLGGPGVGKGTYASLLSMRLCVPHISTGDLIRKELTKPPSSCCTPGELMLRESVRTAMNQGRLVSDEVVFKLLSNQLQRMDPSVGFILDGFPRTVSQAHILDDVVGGVDMAINFHLEDDILVAKCLGRRVCTECGKDYNLAHVNLCTHESTNKGLIKCKRIFLPARLPPPECASTLKVRGDDSNEAAVRERLRLHALESQPLEKFYGLQSKLVDLDVGPGAEDVWPKLLDAISNAEDAVDYGASYYH